MHYELNHDSIAKQIFEKASTEARTRRKIERQIKEAYEDKMHRGAKLTKDDIDYFEPYLNKVNLSPEEIAFIDKAKKGLRRERNRLLAVGLGIIIGLAGLTIFALVQMRLANNKSVEAGALALTSKAAIIPSYEWDKALRLIEVAYAQTENSTSSPIVKRTLAAKFYDQLGSTDNTLTPLYKRELQHDGKVRSAVYSPDGSKILTSSEDGTVKLWDVDGSRPAVLGKDSSDFCAAHLSPTGQYILINSHKNSSTQAKLYDLHGNIIRISNVPNSLFFSHPEFFPEGNLILTSISDSVVAIKNFKAETIAVLSEDHASLSYTTISPDGSLVLTSHSNLITNLWKANGDFVTSLVGQTDAIKSASFSPDGEQILTISSNGTAKLWNLDGIPIASLPHNKMIAEAIFSLSGDYILTKNESKAVYLWNSKGNLIRRLKDKVAAPAYSVIFSNDGHHVLTVTDNHNVNIFNLEGRLETILDLHTSRINSVAFSPDQSLILTSSDDQTAKLWSYEGILIADLNKHTDRVSSAVFSPDGKFIMTASDDHTAKTWNVKGELVAELDKHTGQVAHGSFSPDGQFLITASDDEKATPKLWNLNGELLNAFNELKGNIGSVIFSPPCPKGQICPSGDGKTISINIDDRETPVTILYNKKDDIITYLPPVSLSFSSINNSSNAIESLVIKENDKGNSYEKQWFLNYANRDKFSPNSELILTNSGSGLSKLWNVKNQSYIILTDSITGPVVFSGDFSSDGSQIITSESDTTIKMRNLDGEIIKSFKGHKGWVFDFAFSADEQKILSSSFDSTAILWNINGDIITRLERPGRKIGLAVFSPPCPEGTQCANGDGQLILTSASDTSVFLWDQKGKIVASLEGHNSTINSAIFSPSSNYILTCSDDNTAKLWNTKGKLLADMDKHRVEVNTAFFSPACPDGTTCLEDKDLLILTSSEDNSAKLWNMDGELIADLNKHNDAVLSAIFSSNGEYILTTSADSSAKIWPTPEKIYQYLQTEAGIPALSEKDKLEYGIKE